MTISFKILGTCAGTGVPSFFCGCIGCMEAIHYPQYARTRTGAFLETEKGRLLIDASPDIRSQLVREGINGVDTIFLTHWHADHYAGLGEFEYYVRLLNKKPVNLYLPGTAIADFASSFPELTDVFDVFAWEYSRKYSFGNVWLTPLMANHGVETAGFLIESEHCRLAYFPDTAGLPDVTATQLEGVDYFVCDATFYGENWYPHSHMTIDQAVVLGQQIQARHTILTHLSIHYSQPVTSVNLEKELSKYQNVSVAWDGMSIDLL